MMLTLESLLPSTNVNPRPYQGRIIGKTVDMLMGVYRNAVGELEDNIRNVLIESPTGSGKTVMGLMISKLMEANANALIGWVAMRSNLLHQAHKENGPASDENPDGKSIGVDLNTISMFANELPEHLLPENRNGRPLMLIVDEAQHDAANSMAALHNRLRPDMVLGLTATPFRTDRLKLCFDKVIKDAGIHQLIAEGYLSQYEHFSIPSWSPAEVASTILREPERWGKSLIFFHKKEECIEFNSLIRAGGLTCDVVTADTDREEQIELLRQGHLNMLVNMMILTEGFNMPELETVFTRDSGKGCTIQMAGRVFRKCGSVPLKKVVQSNRTEWPMLKTAMPVTQYVWSADSTEWRSLTINPRLNEINHNARLAIAAATPPELPKFLTQQKGKRRF